MMVFYGIFFQFHEGVRAMWLAEKEGHVYKHPYDVGTYENLTMVKTLRPFFFFLFFPFLPEKYVFNMMYLWKNCLHFIFISTQLFPPTVVLHR